MALFNFPFTNTKGERVVTCGSMMLRIGQIHSGRHHFPNLCHTRKQPLSVRKWNLFLSLNTVKYHLIFQICAWRYCSEIGTLGTGMCFLSSATYKQFPVVHVDIGETVFALICRDIMIIIIINNIMIIIIINK